MGHHKADGNGHLWLHAEFKNLGGEEFVETKGFLGFRGLLKIWAASFATVGQERELRNDRD